MTGDVYGGAIKENVTGEVKGNKVEITGGIINEGHEVHGGHSLYNSVGGTGENDGNKVIIKKKKPNVVVAFIKFKKDFMMMNIFLGMIHFVRELI